MALQIDTITMMMQAPNQTHLICAGDPQPVKDWEKDLWCHHHGHYIGETIKSYISSIAVYLQMDIMT